MPLSGEQKKLYQREYMQKRRLGITGSNMKNGRGERTRTSDLSVPNAAR